MSLGLNNLMNLILLLNFYLFLNLFDYAKCEYYLTQNIKTVKNYIDR